MLTTDLLPALRTGHSDTADARIAAVVARVERYALLWGDDGPMLTCAVQTARRLYQDGQHSDLLDLLRVTADRLYLLSAGPVVRRRDGRDPADS